LADRGFETEAAVRLSPFCGLLQFLDIQFYYFKRQTQSSGASHSCGQKLVTFGIEVQLVGKK
jgi:hypothetical protein